MFDLSSATARWSRIRAVMAELDLDVLLAVDLSRDEILLGHQRWITGYIPVGGPAATLLHRSGAVELISDRIGRPVADHYRSHGFPIEVTSGFSARLVAERVARHAPRRVGLAEADSVSSAMAGALAELVPGVALVDASASMTMVRMVKTPTRSP